MTNQEIINKTVVFVKESLKNAEGGHDWWHIYRVWNNAKTIAQDEEVDLFTVELGALLHDTSLILNFTTVMKKLDQKLLAIFLSHYK